MDSVILINDGGYMGMDNVCFPVEVYVSNLAEHGVAISSSEMERIGCDMSLFDGGCEWWFVTGDYNFGIQQMNRERFEELAKLKGMDVTRANRRVAFVNLGVVEAGEYTSRMTEAAWWGWQEAMKESKDGLL